MLIKYIFYFLLQFYFAKELAGKIIYEFDEGDVLLIVKQSESNQNLLRAETRSRNKEIISYSKIQLDGNSTGWNTITSWTNPKYNDETTSYNVGKNEGIISRQIAYNHWYNYVRTFCDNQEEICVNIKKFIKLNIEWVETMLKKYKTTDPYWWHVNLVYTQLKGFVAGYNLNIISGLEDSSLKLTYTDFLLLNLRGDLFDLVDKYKPKGSPPSKLYEEGHCSAIIKLLAGNKDLYVGHNTWSRYNTMTRATKAYKFTYHKLPNTEEFIPGKTVSFSGYPAEVHSHDDFYIISSGLAVQETTIGNYNEKLWDLVTPEGIVFEFVRIMVANRLATDGKSWSKIFSKYNSGTYNNQWMVVDYNKFTSGKPPKKGLLWILEQIPGHVKSVDQTSVLEKQKYWPSYNVPFYKDIFKLGGNEELVRQYGEWFSYEGAPRAKIFRRDHKKIKSMKSFMDFMRYNNYAHDSYSKCNCTPPYSASNAIAARHDLNPASGTYPFPALGHRGGGATDAKLTNSLLIKKMKFVAVSGPTTGTNLPVFKWSTSDFKDTMPHLGQPDEWNFKPIIAG